MGVSSLKFKEKIDRSDSNYGKRETGTQPEKGMQKTRKAFQNGAKIVVEIQKKSIKNEVRKSMRKKGRMPGPARRVGGWGGRLFYSLIHL